MKKILNDDLSIDELKKMLVGFKQKETCKKNDKMVIIVAVLIAAAILGAIFALFKYLNSDDEFDYFDDFEEEDEDFEEFCDENGCVYTDDEDFE